MRDLKRHAETPWKALQLFDTKLFVNFLIFSLVTIMFYQCTAHSCALIQNLFYFFRLLRPTSSSCSYPHSRSSMLFSTKTAYHNPPSPTSGLFITFPIVVIPVTRSRRVTQVDGPKTVLVSISRRSKFDTRLFNTTFLRLRPFQTYSPDLYHTPLGAPCII